MKRYLVAPLTLLVIGAAAQTWAHHSSAATYLENQTVTIEGELVQFVLRNPHSFVDVDVTEKDGTKTRYVIEWAAPAQLAHLPRDVPAEALRRLEPDEDELEWADVEVFDAHGLDAPAKMA